MRALTPLRSKIRRRNDAVVHDSGRLVASSVFDAALCCRSTSHNPHAGEHDPSACGGQLLIVRPFSMITRAKLEIYKKYNGDIDGIARVGTQIEKETITDEDWFLIDKLRSIAFLLHRSNPTQEYKAEIVTTIKNSTDCRETEMMIYGMV